MNMMALLPLATARDAPTFTSDGTMSASLITECLHPSNLAFVPSEVVSKVSKFVGYPL